MKTKVRKIDLMHHCFGMHGGKRCKECFNLECRKIGRRYYKCRIYGSSNCESTDWRLSYKACGMFNREWNGGRIVELVRSGELFDSEDGPIDGQISFEENLS